MAETYEQSQVRMIRDARRIQEKADTDFARARREHSAPRPSKFCQNCYDVGISAGMERERLKRRPWYTYGFCVLIGAFLGLLLAAAISWMHAGRWHFVGF